MNPASIEDELSQIEKRITALSQKDSFISSQLDQLNKRSESLFRAYKFLNIAFDQALFSDEPVTNEIFQSKFKEITEKLNTSLSQAVTKEARNRASEVWVSKMMALNSARWNSVIAFKEFRTKSRIQLHQKEDVIQQRIIQLEKETNSNESEWIRSAGNAFSEYASLIAEIKEELKAEEIYQQQLESLLEAKNRLFDTAEQLLKS